MQLPVHFPSKLATLLFLALTLLVSSSVDAWAGLQESETEQLARYDHHVHVMSPELVGHWKALGVPFSRDDSAYTDPIEILESQKLDGAFLVSMAHMYTTEDLSSVDDIGANEQSWVQKENDYIASSVAKAPTKLVGFYSVNPLREYAADEIKRCHENEHLTGIKLHLPACGVDLTDAEHVEKLEEVFDLAMELEIPLLVHLFTADQENPQALADMVCKTLIQPRQQIEIIFAHLGAAGGFNETSKAILASFDALVTANPIFENARIRFDLSGAILAEETDGIPATSEKRCQALSTLIKKLGTRRFLFASDYPVFSVEATESTLREKLELNDEELTELLTNASRWFSIKREIATIELPDLRRELLRRAAADQKTRRGLTGSEERKFSTMTMTEKMYANKKMMEVDTENRTWLKEQVKTHGWLGRSKVGSDGAQAAWLMVQHADPDPDFQNHCLELMMAMDDTEVSKANVAYLVDRVLTAAKKPQRYGTQFGTKDGDLKMHECEDVKNLDKRRAEMGLGLIAEYEAMMREAYDMPKQTGNDSKDNDRP